MSLRGRIRRLERAAEAWARTGTPGVVVLCPVEDRAHAALVRAHALSRVDDEHRKPFTGSEIAIVIAAYNEADAIGPVLDSLPTGELMQRPPAYSAVKVGGERLYKRARRGELVEAEPRLVRVHRFEQLWREGERAGFEIECSSGTYVRSLIADLGDAYTESLRRLAIGPFSVDDAGQFLAVDEALGRIEI